MMRKETEAKANLFQALTYQLMIHREDTGIQEKHQFPVLQGCAC